MKYIIIGGGIAAFEGAVAAREARPEAEILLISRESVLPYRRPALSRMVAEELSDNQFYLKDADFFAARRIELKLGCTVSAIDPAARKITADDGEYHYDKLLLAVGASAFIPPVPGADANGVRVLREFSDLEALRRLLKEKQRRIAVIGGGLLGLELADALLRAGATVSVIESAPSLLPRQLDAEGAEFFARAIKAAGEIELYFGQGPDKIDATGVTLADGTRIDADPVLFSAGIRPNLQLAQEAGLQANRGIVVNDRMQTGDPDIYAAGDCAEFNGRVFGLFLPARDMGAVAGTNLAGGDAVFQAAAQFPARLTAFGQKLFSVGEIGGDESAAEAGKENFRKIFLRNGKIIGGILIGDLSQAAAMQSAVAAGADRRRLAEAGLL